MKKNVLFVALAFLSSIFFTGCPGCPGEDAVRVNGLEIKLPASEEIQVGKNCRFEITGKLSGEKKIDFSSIDRYNLRFYIRDENGVLETCEITAASGKESPSGVGEVGYDYDIIKWYDNDKNILFDYECYFYTPHFNEENLSEWIEVKFNKPVNNCYIDADVEFYVSDEWFYGYFYSAKFNVSPAEID